MSDNIPYWQQRSQMKIRGEKSTTEKKEPKPIAKVSEKKKQQDKEAKGEKDELQEWFEARRQEMTGKCIICGGKTEKHNDATFKNSIHHLFEKRSNMFPSVKTIPENWLEVCFFGNSCHTNIHGGLITWEILSDSKEWDLILPKILRVYPHIAPEEHKRIPEVLMEQIKRHS